MDNLILMEINFNDFFVDTFFRFFRGKDERRDVFDMRINLVKKDFNDNEERKRYSY